MRNFDWRSLLRHESGSVLMVIFGVILTFKPDFASEMVSAVLGWLIIAMGVIALVVGFVGKLGLGSIVSGGLMLLVGNWFHRNPLMIASAVGVLLGFLVLSQGWRELWSAGRSKRAGGFWIFGAVLAVVEIAIGIRLILSPMLVSRVVLSVCGIILVICGVCNLTAFGRSRAYLNDGGIIDAE